MQVLVATDIAARGLDIDELPHVVNFDLPNVAGGLRAPHRPHRPRRLAGRRRSRWSRGRARVPARHRAAHQAQDPEDHCRLAPARSAARADRARPDRDRRRHQPRQCPAASRRLQVAVTGALVARQRARQRRRRQPRPRRRQWRQQRRRGGGAPTVIAAAAAATALEAAVAAPTQRRAASRRLTAVDALRARPCPSADAREAREVARPSTLARSQRRRRPRSPARPGSSAAPFSPTCSPATVASASSWSRASPCRDDCTPSAPDRLRRRYGDARRGGGADRRRLHHSRHDDQRRRLAGRVSSRRFRPRRRDRPRGARAGARVRRRLGARRRRHSRVFYNRVKGEMEETSTALGFASVVIARPSLLVGDREALGQPPAAARSGPRACSARCCRWFRRACAVRARSSPRRWSVRSTRPGPGTSRAVSAAQRPSRAASTAAGRRHRAQPSPRFARMRRAFRRRATSTPRPAHAARPSSGCRAGSRAASSGGCRPVGSTPARTAQPASSPCAQSRKRQRAESVATSPKLGAQRVLVGVGRARAQSRRVD